MTTASYSIELQDFNLSADAKQRIDTALNKAVMAELAKLDLVTGERSLPITRLPGGVMGFILRNPINGLPLPSATERSESIPSALQTTFSGNPITDMAFLEVICMRPDVRQAIIANSQAFIELLSSNEQASKNFNALIEKMHSGESTGDRFAPVVIWAVVAGGAALGAAIASASRPRVN